MGVNHAHVRIPVRRLRTRLRGTSVVLRGAADQVPQVQEEKTPPPVRHRGVDHLQGVRVLRDGLPQRVVQVRGEGRGVGGQAGRRRRQGGRGPEGGRQGGGQAGAQVGRGGRFQG